MELVVALLRIAFHATILDYPRGAITLGKVQPVLTSTRVNRNPLLYNYTSILEKNYLLCAMPRILSYPILNLGPSPTIFEPMFRPRFVQLMSLIREPE